MTINVDTMQTENPFTYAYFTEIIDQALDRGYNFVTLAEMNAVLSRGEQPDKPMFVMRHDLDAKPQKMKAIVGLEKQRNVVSSIFVLVRTVEYNIFSHELNLVLRSAIAAGFELGLHANFVESAKIIRQDPIDLLISEINILKAEFGPIKGVACHRTLDYMYNSLPFLQEKWAEVQARTGLQYEAYDSGHMDNVLYVNEGLDPHLCWRNLTPDQAMATGKNILMTTHPHWWHDSFIYEVYYRFSPVQSEICSFDNKRTRA